MSKKALKKDFRMEVKKSLNRFLSIFAIVALGVSFYSGIQSAAPDMRQTGDSYFDDSNLMDIKVLGTMGLTGDDLEALRAVEGVKTVEGCYTEDAYCGEGESQAVVHVESVADSVNLLTAEVGSLPQKAGECFLDYEYAVSMGYEPGDEIELTVESGEDSCLKRTTFTVSGYGSSPCYLSFDRGSTTLGTGEVDAFIYILPEDFDSDIYMVAYILAEGAAEETAYTDEYDSIIDALLDRIEEIEGARCAVRYEEVLVEAQEEIDDAEQEVADGWQELADAEQELADGKQEYEDGKQKLADAEQELEDAKAEVESELAEAEAELLDAEQELADGWQEYEDAKQEVADGEQELADAQAELEDSAATLSNAKSQIADAIKELNAGESEYSDGLAEYKKQSKKAKKQLAAAEKEVKSGESELAAGWEEYEAGLAALNASETELAAAETTLTEQQAQYDTGAAELAAARAQYEQSASQLPALQEAYENAAAQASELQSAYDTASAQVSELQSACSSLSSNISSLQSAAQTAQDNAVSAQNQIETKTSEKNQAESSLVSAQSELASLQSGLSPLQSELASLQSELASLQSELTSLQSQLDSAEDEDEKETLRAQIAELEQSAVSKEQAVKEQEQRIAAQEQAVSAQNQAVSSLSQTIEALGSEIASLSGTAASEQEAAAQYSAQAEALQQELTSLQPQLTAADSQLSALEDGVSEAQSAVASLKASLDTLTSAKATLEEKEAELASAAEQLAAGWKQLEEGKAEITSGQSELAAAKAVLESSEAELESAKEEITAGYEKLESSKAQLDTARSELDSGWAQVKTSQAQVADGEQQLADGRRQLADAKNELADAKTQLADAQAELLDGEKELADGWAEYEDGKAEAEQEVADAQQEIEEARQELLDAEQEIADGEQEVADARQELLDAEQEIADAKEELADLKEPQWYVYDRSALPDNSGLGENAERMANLAQVFPAIFFLVAALISLTTMTRMVEEERTQIGTLKALGYGKIAIASKYIKYAFLATLGGSIVGVLFGEKVFPWIIINAYGILYLHLPQILVPYKWEYGLIAMAIALVCTIGAAVSSCRKALHAVPAELMRPPSPKQGKRVLLEYLPFIWKRLNFTWKSTVRNLVRYKKRFFMTVIGIGGCMGLLLVGYGLRDSIMDVGVRQFDELQVYDAAVIVDTDVSAAKQQAVYDAVSGEDSVQAAKRFYMQSEEIKMTDSKNSGKEWTVYLYVPEDTEQLDLFLNFYNRETGEEYELTDEGAIITEKIANQFGLEPGDSITLEREDGGPVEIPIAQICENYLSHYLYLTPALYEEVYGAAPEYNSIFYVCGTAEEAETVGQSLLSGGNILNITYTTALAVQIESMLGALDIVIIVLIVSAGMLAFVVLYNLNNINVNERRRELATLKVLGFFNGEVGAYVYRENVLLTAVGIVMGIFIGKFLHSFIISTVEVDACMFGRNINGISYVYGSLYTILFSVIVNIVMYFKLKKIDMVESLKSIE